MGPPGRVETAQEDKGRGSFTIDRLVVHFSNFASVPQPTPRGKRHWSGRGNYRGDGKTPRQATLIAVSGARLWGAHGGDRGAHWVCRAARWADLRDALRDDPASQA